MKINTLSFHSPYVANNPHTRKCTNKHQRTLCHMPAVLKTRMGVEIKKWIISTPRLKPLRALHLEPINVVVFHDPTIPNLRVSFALRCFQRLSRPNIATRRFSWYQSRYTRGLFIPVLSSLIHASLRAQTISSSFQNIGVGGRRIISLFRTKRYLHSR